MNSKLYADDDGIATKQSQLLYENHTQRITIAIKVLAWLGLALIFLERLDIWGNTLWVGEPHGCGSHQN